MFNYIASFRQFIVKLRFKENKNKNKQTNMYLLFNNVIIKWYGR